MPDLEQKYRDAHEAYSKNRTDKRKYNAYKKAKQIFVDDRVEQRKAEEKDGRRTFGANVKSEED